MPSLESAATGLPASPEEGNGTLMAFAAYGLWGAFPVYFHALQPAGAWEVLSHRVLWSLLVCLVVLAVQRDAGWVRDVLHRPMLTATLVVAGLTIGTNWTIYVWAVLQGRATDASLGYFFNPLVTVMLGVLVLRERLRRMQWIAVGIGVVAALYLSLAAGGVPWIALGLAFSFAFYGLIKKRVGASLTAMHSLAAETAVLTPIAVGVVIVLAHRQLTTFAGHGAVHASLLVLAGPVTVVPLLLFAAAARRIPLVSMGLIQFVTPVLQLVTAVTLLHEHMGRDRWIGFALVWVALALLSVDSINASFGARKPTGS